MSTNAIGEYALLSDRHVYALAVVRLLPAHDVHIAAEQYVVSQRAQTHVAKRPDVREVADFDAALRQDRAKLDHEAL